MTPFRRRSMDAAVWVPLYAAETIERVGKYGYLGFREEFFGCGSVAVPVSQRDLVEKLGWSDIGLNNHGGSYWEGVYTPSEVFRLSHIKGLEGVNLALIQANSGRRKGEWYVNPDLVLTLRLHRERDSWLCAEEGYAEVIRLCRNSLDEPCKIEIKSEFLKDYLCARGMGLYLTWFRNRDEILESTDHITWGAQGAEQQESHKRWEGRVLPIHEGGELFGSTAAIMHVTRTSIDFGEDVPAITLPSSDSETQSKTWTQNFSGRKLYRVISDLWREEWIEPAPRSARIKGDQLPTAFSYIVDAAGNRESGDALVNSGRWLWFGPDVANALLKNRDGMVHTRHWRHWR
jgi:hypothetical protein